MAGLCSPKHGPILFTVLKNLFVRMFCSRVKTFKLMAGPRSPISSVTAKLISRRWRIVSFCSCANIQQRSNERMVVLPQTWSKAFHGFEELVPLDGMKFFKNIGTYGWAVFPQTRPNSFHVVEELFRLIVSQPCGNIQVDGWAALPSIPCHRPATFAALKTHFVLMLCRLSTTFRWRDVRAPPNTAQLISRSWRVFLSGRYEAFQKHSNLRLGCAPPKHGPVLFTVLKNHLVWMLNIQVYGWAALPNILCYGPAHFAALGNRFVLMLCRLSTTF